MFRFVHIHKPKSLDNVTNLSRLAEETFRNSETAHDDNDTSIAEKNLPSRTVPTNHTSSGYCLTKTIGKNRPSHTTKKAENEGQIQQNYLSGLFLP